jgi:hypothetical protein
VPAVERFTYRGGGIFHLVSPQLDHRLAYAQAVLHVWDGI